MYRQTFCLIVHHFSEQKGWHRRRCTKNVMYSVSNGKEINKYQITGTCCIYAGLSFAHNKGGGGGVGLLVDVDG